MTTQRSLKTRIRTRMGKTGESYAAARRQLMAKAVEFFTALGFPLHMDMSAISGM